MSMKSEEIMAAMKDGFHDVIVMGMTNKEKIRELIWDNLADMIDTLDLGRGLSLCFCHPGSSAVACDDDAPAASCRLCLERWLEQPYTEQFDLRDGRIVVLKRAE